jgi:hypothetical protein
MGLLDEAILSLAQLNRIKSPSLYTLDILKGWANRATGYKVLQQLGAESATPDPKKLFAIALRSKSWLHKLIDRSALLRKIFAEVRYNL